MRHALLAVLAVLILALTGCSQQALIGKFEPKAESVTAKAIINDVRTGNFDAVKAQLDPKYAGPNLDRTLHELAAAFPDGQPEAIETVGANTTYVSKFGSSQKSVVFNLTYEYKFHDKWVLANVVLAQRQGKTQIEGLHIKPMSTSLETSNALTFKDKDATHWLVLVLLAADVLFCLYAFVLCLRTPIARRKWLWAIFTLLGVCTLRFDWSNGHFAFQPLSVQLFSGSMVAQLYGPYVLGLSIPLGAIWFLLARRRWMAASTPPALPATNSAP